MTGWKVLTYDGRPPIQGGSSLLTGPLPLTLLRVELDRSTATCAPGYHFCATPSAALQIAGLWPDGWPARLVHVTALDAITRGNKCRAATLTLVRDATDAEWTAALSTLSAPFSPHVVVMVQEQQAWRAALARPHRDPAAVVTGLQTALAARGLSWTLHRYSDMDARPVWGAAWDARDAWAARDAARDAVWATSRDVWDARDAWNAWAARDAWDALIVQYIRRMGWQTGRPDAWTVGIRDAYRAGLARVWPTGPQGLGWAMTESP